MYSYHQKSFGRRAGSNIAAILSYRSGIALKSSDDGLTKYPHRKNKNEKIISFYTDGKITKYHTKNSLQKMVDEIESAETRKDACIGKEILIALPKELSNKQRLMLSYKYSILLSQILKTKISISLHDENNNGNYHAHIIFLDRHYINNKYAKKKNRNLGIRTGGRELTQILRHQWELLLSQAYKTHKIDKTVSCLSHKDRQSEDSLTDAYINLNKAYKKHGYTRDYKPDTTKFIEPDIQPTQKEYFNADKKNNNLLIQQQNKKLLRIRYDLLVLNSEILRLDKECKIERLKPKEEDYKTVSEHLYAVAQYNKKCNTTNKTTKKRTVLSASLRRAKNQHIPKI